VVGTAEYLHGHDAFVGEPAGYGCVR
jgi:hypothetical protein